MSLRLLLAVCVFCVNAASAQKVKAYPVKVGEIPNKVLPNEAMYVLPAFTAGTVSFKNGTSSSQLLNYNFLLDEMHFINEAGDTLAIADPLLISNVVIDSTLFYYDKGYVREILRQGVYKLAEKKQMVQVNYKTRGGYDTESEIASIKTYETISTNSSQVYHLQVQKDVLFREVTSFYIADASNHFLKVHKRNLYKLFEGKKIRRYLEGHKINFNDEEDLKMLVRANAE